MGQSSRTFILGTLLSLAIHNPHAVAQQAEPAPPTTPTFQINVNRVLVPVVVHDKQGHTVDALTQQDFQVFDDGKPRSISGFTVQTRRATPGATSVPNTSKSSSPGVLPPAAASQSPALPDRITVIVFDDMHLSFEARSYVQIAGVKALDAALAGASLVAVVSTSGKTNSGLTRDKAKLSNAIMGLQLQGIYTNSGADCPKMDYYRADLIENKRDSAATQDAINEVVTVCDPKAPAEVAQRIVDSSAMRALSLGRQDVMTTYATLSELVRRMATLPGRRTLILVSPGFLPIEQEERAAESQLLDRAAQSNVAISALDARGLYTTSITASEDTQGRSPGLIEDMRQNAMRQSENALSELADGTGGRFFHNSNDLDAGFKNIAEAPETVYVLELSLDGIKADGKYHRLTVKTVRDDLDVQARRGYFNPKPEKKKK